MPLLRITAPHFCAGIVFGKWGYPEQAAPILHWVVKQNKHIQHVKRWAEGKNYEWLELHS